LVIQSKMGSRLSCCRPLSAILNYNDFQAYCSAGSIWLGMSVTVSSCCRISDRRNVSLWQNSALSDHFVERLLDEEVEKTLNTLKI
ncbi:MAG: hypothetical protein LUQ65_12120, partial [Candidatus Helarchaeota archaeon]|nr:hypothetical protein [Candidatus Helarchaeota archaeon]